MVTLQQLQAGGVEEAVLGVGCPLCELPPTSPLNDRLNLPHFLVFCPLLGATLSVCRVVFTFTGLWGLLMPRSLNDDI